MEEIKSQKRIKCKHNYCLGSCPLKAELTKGLSGAVLSGEEAWGKDMGPGKHWASCRLSWTLPSARTLKYRLQQSQFLLEERSLTFCALASQPDSVGLWQAFFGVTSFSPEGNCQENSGCEPWAAIVLEGMGISAQRRGSWWLPTAFIITV